MLSFGFRPLHDASYMGYLEIVKLLVSSGADIEAKDHNQYTPLHAAAAGGKFLSLNGHHS